MPGQHPLGRARWRGPQYECAESEEASAAPHGNMLKGSEMTRWWRRQRGRRMLFVFGVLAWIYSTSRVWRDALRDGFTWLSVSQVVFITGMTLLYIVLVVYGWNQPDNKRS